VATSEQKPRREEEMKHGIRNIVEPRFNTDLTSVSSFFVLLFPSGH
jgi:hypothetical protein